MKAVAVLPIMLFFSACQLSSRPNLEDELDYSRLNPKERRSDRDYGGPIVSILKQHTAVRRAYAIWSARSDKVYIVVDSDRDDPSDLSKSIESLDEEWPEVDLLLLESTSQEQAMLTEKLAPFYAR